MPKRRKIQISKLGAAAQAQIEAVIGTKALRKHLSGEAQSGAPGQGRIRVSAPSERTTDGVLFASKAEMLAYLELRDALGRHAFHLQPEFILQEKFTDCEGNKHRAITYKADFLIGPPRTDPAGPVLPGQMVVDSKGMKTELFRLKQKLFLARYRAPLYLPSTKKELREIISRATSQVN